KFLFRHPGREVLFAPDVRDYSHKLLVGLAGGSLALTESVLNEAEYTTSSWGSQSELAEVLILARRGIVRAPRIRTVKFEEMNDAFDDLAHGRIDGRAVLVPSLGD
ncbi:hypothetical protein HIJ39_18090, partial [Sulfobacillus sp. DSM 109850]|nr:hypothetical protein [Sulfobacillus harzensis]